MINQAVHQVDVLLWLIGPVRELFSYWQLGALHKIESGRRHRGADAIRKRSDGRNSGIHRVLARLLERMEIHGTKGTAVITGDKLTTWDVQDDHGDPAPVEKEVMSGASDPMAISLTPFERQFLDFGEACKTRRRPLVSGQDGYRALELVVSAYESAQARQKIAPSPRGSLTNVHARPRSRIECESRPRIRCHSAGTRCSSGLPFSAQQRSSHSAKRPRR